MEKIKLGTRASKLALAQAEIVANKIKTATGLDTEIVKVITSGDKITDKPLYDVGGKGLFVKELEEVLIKGEVDIAIHSMKDIPGIMHSDFEIAATLERRYPHDVLLSQDAQSIADLPKNAIVGTSSPRRIIYLKKHRPDLDIRPIRGNINTRIAKLHNGEYDAIILAEAGMVRLFEEIDNDYCHLIKAEDMLPAVGQGIIALEIRKNDSKMKALCGSINHQKTFDLAMVERAFLERLNADCRTPLAAFARSVEERKIQIDFMLADDNWENILTDSVICDLKDGISNAIIAAEKLQKKLESY